MRGFAGKFLLLLICFVFVKSTLAQTDSLDLTRIIKPYVLGNHPFGNYITRLNHNFNSKSAKRVKIDFTLSRGNVWLPYAESRLLNNTAQRAEMETLIWHYRQRRFNDLGVTDYESRILDADGIFSSYFLSAEIPISKKIDVKTNFKISALTGGEVPYSLITSDQFIEWVHSNIAGGEDPFGRKTLPFNDANLYYKDLEGNELTMKDNEVRFAEASALVTYYPEKQWHKIKFNYSLHTGVTQMNGTFLFDVGAAATAVRHWKYAKNALNWGISVSAIAPSFAQKMPVNIINYPGLLSLESHWNYKIPFKKFNFNIDMNYHLQSAYHRGSEWDHNVIFSRDLSSHGHMAVSHLLRNNQAWSLIFGYEFPKWTVSCFARQDFVVDNGPDAQVGWAFSILL